MNHKEGTKRKKKTRLRSAKGAAGGEFPFLGEVSCGACKWGPSASMFIAAVDMVRFPRAGGVRGGAETNRHKNKEDKDLRR